MVAYVEKENDMDVLNSRIDAIFRVLDALYCGGANISSASKGNERELFVKYVLETVFPPHFRFTSGDVIDSHRNQTGQVDIVLEQARGYSFPMAQTGPRLFLAENVAAVIEVKSDLSSQWDEVIATAEKVASIQRRYSSDNYGEMIDSIENGNMRIAPTTDRDKIIAGIRNQADDPKNKGKPRIYFFVVGFRGWKKDETVVEKLVPGVVDGIFQLDTRKFATRHGRAVGKEVITGTGSLLAFLHWLEISFFDIAERFPAYSEYNR